MEREGTFHPFKGYRFQNSSGQNFNLNLFMTCLQRSFLCQGLEPEMVPGPGGLLSVRRAHSVH